MNKYNLIKSIFITCGDPDLDTTYEAIKKAIKNGVSMIELGIPFSDPVCEGIVIEEANLRAFKNDINIDKIFDFLYKIKDEINITLVLVAYSNIIYSYGPQEFLSNCSKVNIKSLIIHDLPYEEKGEFKDICDKYGITLISTIANAKDDRIKMIAKEAKEFINLDVNYDKLAHVVDVIRTITDTKCILNMNHYDMTQILELITLVDGINIDNDISNIFKKYGKKAPIHLEEYIKNIMNI